MEFSKIIEWLRLSTQQLFWLFLFSSVVLSLLSFAPDTALDALGLGDFRAAYRTWIGLLWILSFCGLVVTVVKSVYHCTSSVVIKRQNLKRLQERLRNSTPPERSILRRYIEGNTRTQKLAIDDGVVQGLMSEKILYRSSQVGDIMMRFDHNIQPWAWDYLKKHSELVKEPEESHGR
jgi:hypothetical protein